jgi:hypothetical protein
MTQDQLVPIEIRQSETPRPEMAKEIVNFQKDFERKASQGYVFHPGSMTLPLGKGIVTLHIANL